MRINARRWIVLVLAVAAVAGGCHVAATAADDNGDLAAIRHAYDRHNYAEAVKLAEAYIQARPDDASVAEVLLVKGQALLKLKRFDDGKQVLLNLLETHPRFDAMPDVHRTLGEAALRRDQELAAKHLARAADLYEKAGKKREAADVLFELARLWERRYIPHMAAQQPVPRDWQARRKAQIRQAAKIYDRIVALKVSDKISAEALFRKAQAIRDRSGRDDANEQAIKVWRDLVKRFPKEPRAAEASYHVGETYERQRRYVEAVDAFEQTVKRYANTTWGKRASHQIERIKRPQLGLSVQGPTQPGDKAEINWSIRNVKTVKLRAFKVELAEMVRRHDWPREMHTWTPPARADASWTFTTPDQGKHQHYNSRVRDRRRPDQVLDEDAHEPTHLPITEPGAYLVEGKAPSREGKHVRAVTLVLVSKLGLVTKTGRRMGIVWAIDSQSGKPFVGTDALILRYDGRRLVDHETKQVNDSGLVTVEYESHQKRFGRQLAFVVRNGDHYAMCRDLYEWGWWGWQYPYRVYGFTERPVYRPEQTVKFKQIVRRHDEGDYRNAPETKVQVRIRDPRNQIVYDQTLTTNADGSISGEMTLGDEPPLGVYRIEVEVGKQWYRPSHCRGNHFRVEEYKKPEFEVDVAAGKPSYRVGDAIEIKVSARYMFGEPVAGAGVEYEVWKTAWHSTYTPPRPYPWYFRELGRRPRFGGMVGGGRDGYGGGGYGRPHGARRELVKRGKTQTDDKGVATIGPIKSEPYEKTPELDLQYHVTARVVDKSRREIRGSGSVKVTHAPFFIHLTPQRHMYKPGDNAQINIVAKGPNGDPIGFEGRADIHRLKSKLVDKDGREWREYELGDRIHRMDVKVGDNGRGKLRYPFDEEGVFRVILTTTTKAGDEVTGQCDLWIAERGGEYAHYAYRDLELIVDRDMGEIGKPLRVLINSRHENAYVLLTGETDQLLFHRIEFIKGKSTVVELPITARHTPNFHLQAVLLRDDMMYEDRQNIIVPPEQQFLTVEAKPNKQSYRPREKGQVVIAARDSNGKPVSTELAVMMVDASVYYIQPEFREQIQKYFYGQLRPLMVTTRTSFAYRDRGYGRAYGGGGFGRELSRARSLGYAEAPESVQADAVAAAPAPRAPARAKMAAKGDMNEVAREPAPVVKEAMVRKEFADTVVWMAHAKTDADGTATVDVTMPDNLTKWTMHTIACDRQTRVGETSLDVVTRKNLIVRLETPRFLVEKDMVYLSAIVHNYLDTAKKARVELNVTPQIEITRAISHGKELEFDEEPVQGPTLLRRWVEVPPEKEVRVDFVCHVTGFGQAKIVAKALTDEESDAMELPLPVLPYGADKFIAQAGTLRDVPDGKVEMVVDVPAEIKPASQSLDVRTNPTIAAVMIDALPYLLEYPYGCTEQTLSRFVPAVVTAKALQKLGISLEEVRKKVETQGGPKNERQLERMRRNPVFSTETMNTMIRAGLKRLADFQHDDGGWGWWQHDQSNPYMTAYAVTALVEAREADIAFDRNMLKPAVGFLKKWAVSAKPAGRYAWAYDDHNIRAWILYALARENPGNIQAEAETRRALNDLWAARDKLTDYGRALLALTLADVGDAKRAGIVIENFDNTVRIHEDTQTVSWGRDRGWWRWYDNGLETTAMVLRAYMAVEPDHRYVPMIVRWLVRNRQGARWYSTKDTAQCVYALAGYLQGSGELNPDMTLTVRVDGQVRNTLRVTKANVLAVDASTLIGPADLGPGKHTITIHKQGRGHLYAAGYLRYFTKEDPIKGAGHEVLVQRTYKRLVPKEVTKTRKVWDRKARKHIEERYTTIEYDRKPIEPGQELPSGTLIEVRLGIEAKNNFEYMLFEDPKPAGCEPVRLVSGRTYAGGMCSNLELRDERVVFFSTYLSQGRHELTYKLRCEVPGVFHALPTRAEAMYAPLVRAISDSAKLAVVDEE